MSYCSWIEEDRSCEIALKSETVNIWGSENIPRQCCMPFKIWVRAFKANVHSCMSSSSNCLELTESCKKLFFIISRVRVIEIHLRRLFVFPHIHSSGVGFFFYIRQLLQISVRLLAHCLFKKYSTSYDNMKNRLSNRN